MVRFTKTKYGFSLVEALVVMTVAAIFTAVIASVIPHKSQPKISAEAHGGFECFLGNDGKAYYRNIIAGKEQEAIKSAHNDHCVFRPNKYANYLIFNVVGGGGYGKDGENGATGQYTSAFISTPQASYNLYPGIGGTSSLTGGISYVTSGNKNIVSVNGGNSITLAGDTTVDDIIDVYQAGHMDSNVVYYGCNYTPRVWLSNEDHKIHVEYCANKTTIVEDAFEYSNNYSNEKQRYKTIKNSPVRDSNDTRVLSNISANDRTVWEYYDVGALLDAGYSPSKLPPDCTVDQLIAMNDSKCPSRYKIKIKLNINTDNVSTLTKYANLMQYNKLYNIAPGNGGAVGGNGNTGAILVSW